MKKKEQLKNIVASFVDSEENEFYVSLGRSRLNYSKLVNALNNPFKIILLYGPPGSGKSFTFNKFFVEFREKYPIYLFKTPGFNMKSLITIYNSLSNESISEIDTHGILEKFRGFDKEIIIMLDEAQLYSIEEMEWIRLLSNERNLKFIISVHKVENEDVLAQKHFQTRIYETISFSNLNLNDIRQFIEEKLILVESGNYFSKFNKKSFSLLYKFTNGNLRDINRILNRLFNLLLLNVENNESFNISEKVMNKYIEMSAIDLKMINTKSWIFKWK